MATFTLAFMAIGSGELVVILLAILLLFGAKDAPRILRTLQTGFDKLQRAATDFRYAMIYNDVHRTPPPTQPEELHEPLPEANNESESASISHEKSIS